MPSPVIPLFKPGDLEAIEAAGAPPAQAAPALASVPPAIGQPGYVAPIQHTPVEGPVHRPDLEPPPAAAPPPPPQGGVPAQDAANADLRTALADQDTARADMATATADQDAAKATHEADRAARQVAHDEEAARHMRRAKSDVQESRRQAESEPWTTLQSTRSVGGKILQAIGLLATGVSWNSNHVNRGIEVLKQAEDEHFALQKEKHAALFKAVDDAEAGVKDLDAQQMHEMAQLQTREAARWAAIAAKTGAAISAAKGRYDTAVLKQVHAEALSKSGEAHDNAVKAKATAAHLEAQTEKLEAETAEIGPNAEANRRYKEAQARYRELKDKKGTGGGGSSAAFDQFVSAAGSLKPGEPITSELAELGRKAGFKKEAIPDQVKKYAGQAAPPKAGAAGQRSTKEIADLDSSIRNLDTLIGQIEKNPKAWDEYRQNAIDWAKNKRVRESWVGGIGQAAGIANLRAEQGLKTEDAKTLFQRQEKLNTDIAKSFGGVITEGDREAAASNQGNFALDSKGKIAQLKEMRDNVMKRRESWGGVTPASGSPDAASSKPDRVVGGVTYKWTGTGYKAAP